MQSNLAVSSPRSLAMAARRPALRRAPAAQVGDNDDANDDRRRAIAAVVAIFQAQIDVLQAPDAGESIEDALERRDRLVGELTESQRSLARLTGRVVARLCDRRTPLPV